MSTTCETQLPFDGSLTANFIFKAATTNLSSLAYNELAKNAIGEASERLSYRFLKIFYIYMYIEQGSKPELSRALLNLASDGFFTKLKEEVNKSKENHQVVIAILNAWLPMVERLTRSALTTGHPDLIKVTRLLETKIKTFAASKLGQAARRDKLCLIS